MGWYHWSPTFSLWDALFYWWLRAELVGAGGTSEFSRFSHRSIKVWINNHVILNKKKLILIKKGNNIKAGQLRWVAWFVSKFGSCEWSCEAKLFLKFQIEINMLQKEMSFFWQFVSFLVDSLHFCLCKQGLF